MGKNEIKPTTAAEVTPEMIAEWKKQFPNGLFKLKVGDKTGYVRNASRENIKYAMTQMQNGGPIGILESILLETWLGGDEEILTKDEYFMGSMMQMQELMQVQTSELEKL